jgi:hypothetical protein
MVIGDGAMLARGLAWLPSFARGCDPRWDYTAYIKLFAALAEIFAARKLPCGDCP